MFFIKKLDEIETRLAAELDDGLEQVGSNSEAKAKVEF